MARIDRARARGAGSGRRRLRFVAGACRQACGELGNQGAHELDIARWGLGVKLPVKVNAVGGHLMRRGSHSGGKPAFGRLSDRVGLNCPRGKKARSKRACRQNGGPTTVGNIFMGTNGYLTIEGYDRYKSFLGKEQQPGPAKVELRSRDRTKLNGPIEEGALPVTLMRLANISYKVGRSLNIDPMSGAVIGDAEAARLYRRERNRAPFAVPEKV
jgi:predicted dehydrogenase